MHSLPPKMIDLHAHVLPAMDDGAADCRIAAQMLIRLHEQGVTHVVASSHFYRHDETVGEFLRRRERSLAQLREFLAAENAEYVPEIIPAAEVYFTTALDNEPELEKLCISGTNYMLIELPYAQITRNVTDSFRSFASRGRVRPIIAHIEHYAAFADEDTLFDLLDIAPAQINCEAAVTVSTGRLASKLLRSGGIVAIGTDAHNMTDRAPRFSEARKRISRKIGVGAFAAIMESSAAILENRDL